jgi:hypothetical protein
MKALILNEQLNKLKIRYNCRRKLFAITANVLGLGEVGDFEAPMLNKSQMLIEVRMLKFSTSAPILPSPC